MRPDGSGESPEQAAREVFGERAAFYVGSTAHTDAAVLARVVELARPQAGWRALDVATGAGHTAFALAPHVSSVVAVDLTPEMLAEARKLRDARGIANVEFQVADVHSLPFADGALDLVTCRRAAHHFGDIRLALAEMRRVLLPGGRLVIDDRSVPDDGFIDECMNRLDALHDRSHVHEYRPGEWREMLEAGGFVVEAVEAYTRDRPLTSLTNGTSPDEAAEIHAVVDALTPQQREALGVHDVNGELYGTHWYVMAAAVRVK
jgi:SAM-dependent methyltransferase